MKKEIKELYYLQNYTEIFSRCEKSMQYTLDDSIFLGFSLLEAGYFSEALSCLEKIEEKDIVLNERGKYYRYKGLAYYFLNNYDYAFASLKRGIEFYDDESRLWKKLLFIDTKETCEVDNIIFRFVDSVDRLERKLLIKLCLNTYYRLKEFLELDFDKKINIYIYGQPQDALGNRLSYTDNGMKIIYLYKNDMVSHEVAHLLVNSLYINMNRNIFIDEGIATFLSSGLGYQKYLEKFRSIFVQFDVLDCWENGANIYELKNRDSYYYVAGALIGFMLNRYGKNKLMDFIKDESIHNAIKVFGSLFAEELNIFYKDIGFVSQKVNMNISI